jgi:hypothetical protein
MRLIPLIALIAIATACPVAPVPGGSGDRGSAADGGNAPNDGGGANNDAGVAGDDAGTAPTTDAGSSEDAGEQPSHDLIGTWLADPGEEEVFGLAFREDGRMVILEGLNPCLPRATANYTIEGSTLVLEIDGVTRVPFSWDGQALLLDTDDGEMRFVRTADNCHVVPASVSVVGTWEILDDEDPEAPQAIAFTDTGLMFFLSDQAECSIIRFFEYRTEGDQLIFNIEDRENSVPYTLIGDVMSIDNETRMRRVQADCHERYRESSDLPAAIIGTYTADPPAPEDAVLLALRADNTMVGISEQAGCVVAYTWPVTTYGQSLLIETEDGRFPVQWRQEGSNVILTTPDGDDLTLSRVRTDCHSLP